MNPNADQEALGMVKQAVADYCATLPPAARAATELYYRGVLPRLALAPVAQLREAGDGNPVGQPQVAAP